jgi:hypothetical protein
MAWRESQDVSACVEKTEDGDQARKIVDRHSNFHLDAKTEPTNFPDIEAKT